MPQASCLQKIPSRKPQVHLTLRAILLSATQRSMFPFINPKTDFAVKKIFGSPQSKNVLLSFLNSLLYEDESIIQNLTLIDPYQAPRIEGVSRYSTYWASKSECWTARPRKGRRGGEQITKIAIALC